MSQVKKQTPDEEARLEDAQQYPDLAEDDARYPHRPHNHGLTLPFADLYRELFLPLSTIKAQPSGSGGRATTTTATAARWKNRDHGASRQTPHEQRRQVIGRFMGRWRQEVGDDFYPALRLILPDKDRDRAVYGLKENTIGKLLVKLMKIDRRSEDGQALMHWKLPSSSSGGGRGSSSSAGDFAARCYEVLAKRPLRSESEASDLRIGQVNVLLDRLAAAHGEAQQMPLWETLYQHMNASELTWLIRIVLKQLKVGASERTILTLWHPDGEALFGVSSSLRRVCWELTDPSTRLEGGEGHQVELMQCFQPQLAQFQTSSMSFAKMVAKLGGTEADPEFWIEEKLDGERMQMHVVSEEEGRFRFAFWSRKATDYTDLYGDSLDNKTSALTQHLQGAFAAGVRNLVLDGEMITWDPVRDKIVAFGTLKTAALEAQQNPQSTTAPRPVFRVFDLLYLNDQPLTRYTLRDRHRALERAVLGVPRRLEVHPYVSATSADAVEPMLRQIVADGSEGLVLKNPRSLYRLNSRHDDWIKVKPEYMTEFGESFDCVVIGGYYGSGRRGGTLSSFLCGLRVGQNHRVAGAHEEQCLSFFKVGGGFKTDDYAEIRHLTEGKWHDWGDEIESKQIVVLAGGDRNPQEKPDVWIHPRDSVVLSVKAASLAPTDAFAVGVTLRFPRFRRLRLDRTWDSALDMDQFAALRERIDQDEAAKKAMQIEDRRRHRPTKRAKLVVIAGEERSERSEKSTAAGGTSTTSGGVPPGPPETTFSGLTFCVLSEAGKPIRKSKPQLEALIRQHGGRVVQRPSSSGNVIIHIADKPVLRAASLIKAGGVDIVRPRWLLDCVAARCKLPYEMDRHLLHATEDTEDDVADHVDMYGDAYARDLDGVDELRRLVEAMPSGTSSPFSKSLFLQQLEEHGHPDVVQGRGQMFRRFFFWFDERSEEKRSEEKKIKRYVQYCGGHINESLDDTTTTHVIVMDDADTSRLRKILSTRPKQPRLVRPSWILACWKERTVLDEELY